MGTNYYLRMNWCECCGRGDDIHIGKSSGGWCFSLHVDPFKNINSLADWQTLWNETVLGGIDGKVKHKNVIYNEYNEVVKPEEMMNIITNRGDPDRDWNVPPTLHYTSWEDFHKHNYSEAGPNGLLRHKINEYHCIAHGDGTYDLMIGKFS